MRLGVFADVSNLYFCTSKKFRAKLNYRSYLEFIKTLGTVTKAYAYGAQFRHEADNFIHSLQNAGFETRYKTPKIFGDQQRKADWDVGIAVDMIDAAINRVVDTIILGTGDGDLTPAVTWIMRTYHIPTIVVACGISKDLKQAASEWIEIYPKLLEPRNETPDPN